MVLTGDFNKGAERELPPGASDSQRRISPPEAAFSSAVTPLWGPGDEHYGDKWPDCCGFVVLTKPVAHHEARVLQRQASLPWPQVHRPDVAL